MKEDENKMQDNMTTNRGVLSKTAAYGENPDTDLPKTKKTNKEKAIEMLNVLIGINDDRIVGYETALYETPDVDLKSLFLQFIQTNKKCRQESDAEVERPGGTPT